MYVYVCWNLKIKGAPNVSGVVVLPTNLTDSGRTITWAHTDHTLCTVMLISTDSQILIRIKRTSTGSNELIELINRLIRYDYALKRF